MGSIDTGLILDGRYRIIARRASGATATVWETQDEFLRRRVAVKILHEHLAADADLHARFLDEAHAAATVSHPNLVAVYDSISDQPGIVLEWIDGPDLRQRLDAGPLTPAETVEVGTAISAGLGALHARGLVHRDIKPANILLPDDGGAKLTDFGIATTNAGDRTATGVVLGTAKYLAPEQVRGQPLDGRTDLFALAAVLYECLTGAPPWVRDGDLATALARLEVDPVDPRVTHPQLPPALVATVMRGLARDPAARWATARDFARALESGSTLAPPPARPRGTPPSDATAVLRSPDRPTPPLRPRRRRWPRVLAAAGFGAIAILGWTLVLAIDADSPRPGSDSQPVTLRSATAFDPEGTGQPGEHDEQAPRAIDGDLDSVWTTERYSSRDLGAKSGVGLVVTLDGVGDIAQVSVRTRDGDDWAAEIRVSSGVRPDEAGSIDDFGPPVAAGTGLDSVADFDVGARGDTVVVWITDLGAGSPPVQLAVSEITVR